MGLFSKTASPQDDSVAVTLLIGEIRDLRSDMGNRDERVYNKIDSVEKTMSKLSEDVTRSQGDVGAIRTDVDRLTENVDSLKGSVGTIKKDVDELSTAKTIAEQTWFGPKHAKTIVLIAAVLAAMTAIVGRGPHLLALFSAG